MDQDSASPDTAGNFLWPDRVKVYMLLGRAKCLSTFSATLSLLNIMAKILFSELSAVLEVSNESNCNSTHSKAHQTKVQKGRGYVTNNKISRNEADCFLLHLVALLPSSHLCLGIMLIFTSFPLSWSCSWLFFWLGTYL